jgi:two-component system, OmpR family, alkaline phosphatase synthesis response regulator PhoP
MAKILVIDDEVELTELVKFRLEKQGYEVSVAHDGISGFGKAREERPDLIILDVMLPGMDGYKICRLLKFDERYQKIPIMLFTARLGSDEKTCVQLGVDAIVPKPFEASIFIQKVEELLRPKAEKGGVA